MRRAPDRFYQGRAWQRCRAAYYAEQHGICERCGKLGDIVHHKVYLNRENVNDPEISLNADNLELLCMECHNKEHFKNESEIDDALMFDEEGNVIEKSPHL